MNDQGYWKKRTGIHSEGYTAQAGKLDSALPWMWPEVKEYGGGGGGGEGEFRQFVTVSCQRNYSVTYCT